MTQSIITRCAGIMAGGEGSRLSAPGGSKGLVEVAGIPLVEYVLKQFEVAEISHVLFAAHDRDSRLRQFIRDLSSSSRFESVDYVSSDARPGTGGAVRTIVDYYGSTPHIISTIDLIAPSIMTRELVTFVQHMDDTALSVVAASPLIHDADPLWVEFDHSGVVTAFGKDVSPTDHVFGNIRWFSSAAAEAINALDLADAPHRDSAIMKRLITSFPASVRAFPFSPVFDVDDWDDVALAEAWISSPDPSTSPGT